MPPEMITKRVIKVEGTAVKSTCDVNKLSSALRLFSYNVKLGRPQKAWLNILILVLRN